MPPYRSPWWLQGGHAQTILPKFIRQAAVEYRRELHPDSSGKTVVAYDFIDGNIAAPLVVLFHGLEGSSTSHYAISLAHAVQRRGWRLVVAHYRSCGGVENSAPIFYHSGDSEEISFVLKSLRQYAPTLLAVGVSLGGNVLAKYLGEAQSSAICTASAVISAPLDLSAAATALERPLARRLYTPYFFKTLIPKACALTDGALTAQLHRCRTLTEFDNLFTAPLHGFADAHDYYHRSSAKPLLRHISTPTLVINAQNDPFMHATALPTQREVADTVTLLQPAAGGHVGFYDQHRNDKLSWLPETVLVFFENVLNNSQRT